MVICARIKDRARFIEEYGKPAAALVARMGGRYVVRAPGAVSLEGGYGAGASVVVSEWPDKAAIERFWNSPEYAVLKAARAPLAVVDVLVVEQP
jgi:uncharacterized protein (DUF1330 family)